MFGVLAKGTDPARSVKSLEAALNTLHLDGKCRSALDTLVRLPSQSFG